jgi:tRNA threonylcarbamoyl adenosine modification protein (Sua5/YciO/YrdC/YwlC family)
MSDRYDCSDSEQRAAGLKAAVEAVRRGELVVLPTDTVYGIGADAFSPAAVTSLLAAKRRGRDMPPPVLVGTVRAAAALVEEFSDVGKDFIEAFWPGGLTLVCRARRTLSWDLGDARGTVAIRMPMHPVALGLLKETGPLAVSSANLSGLPAATTVDEAMGQLGDSVAVFLDGGPATGGVPSTIVDLTGPLPRLLRAGTIPVEELDTVFPVSVGPAAGGEAAEPSEAAESAEAGEAFGITEAAENAEISDAYPMAPGTPSAPAPHDLPGHGSAAANGGSPGEGGAAAEQREPQ